MKKIAKCLSLVAVMFLSVVLGACGHQHSLEWWKIDETHHWKICVECNEKIDVEAHDWQNGECSVCGTPAPAQSSSGLEFEYADYHENSWAVVGLGTTEDTTVAIPSTHQGKPVVKIGYQAFKYDGAPGYDRLEKIVIPSSITEIGPEAFAFRECEVEFSEWSTITEIGERAFENFMGLGIEIPETVQQLDIVRLRTMAEQ